MESKIERALALGAARSAAASRLPQTPDPRTLARRFWERRRRLIIGLALFLLFDLIVGFAAVTMGTHF